MKHVHWLLMIDLVSYSPPVVSEFPSHPSLEALLVPQPQVQHSEPGKSTYPLGKRSHSDCWNDIPMFNRKYIDSIQGPHFPASYLSLLRFPIVGWNHCHSLAFRFFVVNINFNFNIENPMILSLSQWTLKKKV